MLGACHSGGLCIGSPIDRPLELRDLLITVVDRWERICLNTICPIQFGEAERKRHKEEYENYIYYKTRFDLLRTHVDCDTSGWVPIERFEQANRVMEKIRQQWNPEEEKGPFPLDEGSYSYFLT